jgi:hypothetical protein
MRTAATVTLIAFLCFSCSGSQPEGRAAGSKEVSQALVGKRITIRRKLSLRGKVGPYIVLDNQQVVYLEATKGSFTWAKPYSEMEGQVVAATGTLRFYHEPPSAEPAGGAVAVQRVRDHFYFDAETAQVRLVGP